MSKKEDGSRDHIVKHFLEIQRLRVAIENHIRQLEENKRTVTTTTKLVQQTLSESESLITDDMTGFIDSDLIASEIWETWAKDVKGIGKSLLAQVLLVANNLPGRHVSSLWKFFGMSVEDGQAPKHQRGQKITYNPVARMIAFKIGQQIILQNNGIYRELYDNAKEFYTNRAKLEGKKVIPAAQLKTKKNKEGYMSEGHIHNRARRKMVKRWLADLWEIWTGIMGEEFVKIYGHEPQGPYIERLKGHKIVKAKISG